jgi:signal recognition particle subunit SEC65
MVVWSASLDSARSRSKGRKLSSGRAVRQPSLKEIVQAANSLGLSPEPVEKAALPMSHWDKTGCVVVKRSGGRMASLKSLAGEIARARQREAQAVAAEPKRDRR